MPTNPNPNPYAFMPTNPTPNPMPSCLQTQPPNPMPDPTSPHLPPPSPQRHVHRRPRAPGATPCHSSGSWTESDTHAWVSLGGLRPGWARPHRCAPLPDRVLRDRTEGEGVKVWGWGYAVCVQLRGGVCGGLGRTWVTLAVSAGRRYQTCTRLGGPGVGPHWRAPAQKVSFASRPWAVGSGPCWRLSTTPTPRHS